jgi:hypothetical protein
VAAAAVVGGGGGLWCVAAAEDAQDGECTSVRVGAWIGGRVQPRVRWVSMVVVALFCARAEESIVGGAMADGLKKQGSAAGGATK